MLNRSLATISTASSRVRRRFRRSAQRASATPRLVVHPHGRAKTVELCSGQRGEGFPREGACQQSSSRSPSRLLPLSHPVCSSQEGSTSTHTARFCSIALPPGRHALPHDRASASMASIAKMCGRGKFLPWELSGETTIRTEHVTRPLFHSPYLAPPLALNLRASPCFSSFCVKLVFLASERSRLVLAAVGGGGPGAQVVGASGRQPRPLGDGTSVSPELVAVVVGFPALRPAGGRVFPRLLPPVDGEVHERVAVVHGLYAADGRPVGLEDAVPVPYVAHEMHHADFAPDEERLEGGVC